MPWTMLYFIITLAVMFYDYSGVAPPPFFCIGAIQLLRNAVGGGRVSAFLKKSILKMYDQCY